MAANAQRYTATAIVLHWAIALGIAFMIPLGFWMHGEAEDGRYTPGLLSAYQLHKSVGLTILLLSLARLGWRLANPPPPLPAAMPAWEKAAAKATHWAFYALIVLMPLTGWLYVSAGWSYHEDTPLQVTTRWFGLFNVPALFDLVNADDNTRRDIAKAALRAHWALAWGTIGLAVLHVAAALKHQFVNRDEVLGHMVPGVGQKQDAPRSARRNLLLGGGLAAVAVAMVTLLYAVANLEPAAAPTTTQAEVEAPASTDTATAATAEGQTTTTAPTPANAPPVWTVNQSASSIAFAATYTDDEGSSAINGRFARWRADIRFDPANLEQSSAVVTVDVGSAATGTELNDQTLKGETWFNAVQQANAVFRTTRIRHREGNQYEARGTLTIKGHSEDVRLPFTLTIDGNRARMEGRTSLRRRDYDLGLRDETGNEHVGPDVVVNVRVEATR